MHIDIMYSILCSIDLFTITIYAFVSSMWYIQDLLSVSQCTTLKSKKAKKESKKNSKRNDEIKSSAAS